MDNASSKNRTTRISLSDIIASQQKKETGSISATSNIKSKTSAFKKNTTRIILLDDNEETKLYDESEKRVVSKAETEPISAVPFPQDTPKPPII